MSKQELQRIRNDLHQARQRFQTISITLTHHIGLLLVTLLCIIFITVCGIQHIQRGSYQKPMNMFESLYFVIVTFSTVGYGDISPDIYLGQIFIMIMIVVAFSLFPYQVQVIALTWMERQKLGGVYSKNHSKHVIVCATSLSLETVMDFLNEFYAHRKLEHHNVVLLSPHELDGNIQIILKDPKWMHRVFYIRGSALKDIDMRRCRLREAEACFLLPPRLTNDKDKADQHTVLRSWAVKDYAPHCKQYIHLFKATNKMHVKFAEHLVCEDEFKYALLANNCLYPGLSTLVSLLVHTSTGLEGDIATSHWQQVYGHHSGNEIYHIQLCKSFFFREYVGWAFPKASASAHSRYGVLLLAVLTGEDGCSQRLQLNPGNDYKLRSTDFCFYMSVTREEYAKINPSALGCAPAQLQDNERLASALQKYSEVLSDMEPELEASAYDTVTNLDSSHRSRRPRLSRVVENAHKETTQESSSGDEHQKNPPINNNASEDIEMSPLLTQKGRFQSVRVEEVDGGEAGDGASQDRSYDKLDHRHDSGRLAQYFPNIKKHLKKDHPPITIYTWSNRAECHLMRDPRQNCCLQWNHTCEHGDYRYANDKRWDHHLIIIAAQKASSGLYNFIVPLRSSFISVEGLSAIIIMLETPPDQLFLDFMAKFPLVFWMQGSLNSLDDLLLAGINKARHLVVVNRHSEDRGADNHMSFAEETLVDSDTIITVQTIFRLFPNANIITELNQASNMRFMQFSADDVYCHKISRLEQKLKTRLNSNLSHIFRLPFAAGQVFSASMLDTLLYQTFVKGYLIAFVRLLLGIDAEEGSGHLSSIRVTRGMTHNYPTFGDMYKHLCNSSGEIPFALYHTGREKNGDDTKPPEQGRRKSFLKRTPKKPPMPRVGSYVTSTSPLHSFRSTQMDVKGLVHNRMTKLGMDHDYCEEKKTPDAISYIIANPSPQRKLKMGDIIYVIQPSSIEAKPNRPTLPLPLRRSNSLPGINSSLLSSSSQDINSHTFTLGGRLFSPGPRPSLPSPRLSDLDEVDIGHRDGPLSVRFNLEGQDQGQEQGKSSGEQVKQIGRFNLKKVTLRKNSCPAGDSVERGSLHS